MKLYVVYVKGVDLNGSDYEEVKGVFTTEEKAKTAIEYGRSCDYPCYHSGHWYYEEYIADMFDDYKKI